MMLEAAARSDGLKAVVSEGAGIRSVREGADAPNAGLLSNLSWAIQTVGVSLFSNEAVPRNLLDLMPEIAPTPILLIYASEGQGGEELNADYYEAAGKPKDVWEVPEGGHVGSQDAFPQEYERRVIGFFDAALLGERG